MNIPAEVIETAETRLHTAIIALREESHEHDGEHVLQGHYTVIHATRFNEVMADLLFVLEKLRAYKP